MAEIKQRSSMSNEQGIIWIDSITKDISNCADLKAHTFGISVGEHLKSMRASLKDGVFFSSEMERALKNWNTAVLKWSKTKQTEQ
jgi:hypothetical protein